MKLEILYQLISEGDRLTHTINFVPARPNVLISFSVYTSSEQQEYLIWQSSVQRFVKTNYLSELHNITEASKKLSPDNHNKILAVLRAIELFPNEPESFSHQKENSKNSIVITNNQNVSQNVTVNHFVDVLREQLSGNDFKSLKEILKDYDVNPEVTKSKLIDKIKGFGSDVMSNIIANVLTNQEFYKFLFQ